MMTGRITLTYWLNGKGDAMKKLFKSKKVVGAIIALVVALVSVGLGVDLGEGTEGSVTDVVCQVITCE